MPAPFHVGVPSPATLATLLESQAGADLTYAEVGATWGGLPSGYHVVRRSVVLGRDDRAFAAGAAALRRWAGHTGARVAVVPTDAPLAEDQDVLLVIARRLVSVTAACRIVAAVDTPDRFGFAYGSLPLHAVSGEESFLVEREPDGTVRFTIVAFSRPSTFLTRLGGPVTRIVQRMTTAAYLEGVRSAAESTERP